MVLGIELGLQDLQPWPCASMIIAEPCPAFLGGAAVRGLGWHLLLASPWLSGCAPPRWMCGEAPSQPIACAEISGFRGTG